MQNKITANYINPDLHFLINRNVIYYAGLDTKSFPFNKGEKSISKIGKKNLTYIKVLSLFVDNIVIPPTFFIDTLANKSDSISYLSPLFQSNLIISSIDNYSKDTSEFLYKKLKDRKLISKIPFKNYKILQNLFFEIPIIRRNVKIQSSGFRNKILENLKFASEIPSFIVDDLINHINNLEKQTGIVLSRNDAIKLLEIFCKKHNLSNKIYRHLFYLFNEAYYSEGAQTYFANVSLVNSDQYALLYKKSITKNSSKILFGYDPELILHILKGFLISEEHIDRLTIEDILKIKQSSEYEYFVNRFKIFVDLLQEAALDLSTLSNERILSFKQEIQTKFNAEYHSGLKFIEKYKYKFGFYEATSWSILTGALGFFIIPFYGALLGLLPTIIYATKTSQGIVDFILSRIYSRNISFYNYIELLSEQIFELKTKK